MKESEYTPVSPYAEFTISFGFRMTLSNGPETTGFTTNTQKLTLTPIMRSVVSSFPMSAGFWSENIRKWQPKGNNSIYPTY
jgi:hypothetical protein